MATSNTVAFEVIPTSNYVFSNTNPDDLVVYSTTSNQRMFFGPGSNTTAVLVLSNNAVGIAKSNPAYTLDVAGIVNATSLYVGGAPYIGSQFSNTSSNVFLTGSNLGLGKSNPAYTLDVAGIVNATSLYVGGAPYIGSQFSNTSSNVFLTGSNLGLGKSNPAYTLDVAGTAAFSNLIAGGATFSNPVTMLSNLTVNGPTAFSNVATFNSNVVIQGQSVTTGGATFSNPAIFLSNVNINGVLAVSNVTYITSNIIVYNNEIINSNLFASNLVLAGSATVSNSLTILSNLNIANALTLNGIALSKRNTAGLTNITTLAITGYSYSSNGVGLTGSNFITFSGSNSEFSRYNGKGFFGINTTAPTGYLEVRNFARHPVEGLTWTSSNALLTAYTAPMDTNSNLTIKILASSASNTTLLSTAFSASNNAFLSSNNVYNASGVPNATIQTLVAGSNYSGEWIELDMPSAIVANEIYINANASTFTLAASSNANATFALLYYTNSNTPYTPAFYDFSTNTTPYSNYRLIINRTTTNNSNISVTTFKVYGSAASNPATTIDNDTLTVSKGTLTVNGGMQVNTDTINFANSNGPIELPPAALNSNATTIVGQTYANGTYIASSSSFMAGRPTWQAFDKSSNALSIWTASSESYSSSTGNYTGGVYSTTLANGVSIAGEWLQIQLPQSMTLQSFIIAPTPTTFSQNSTTYSFAQVRSPNTFTILGSENGTSWQIVYSTANVNTWDTSGAGASKTFTVAAQPTTPAYKYYRMVIQAIGQTYIGATGNYYAELAEWRLFGTFPAALLTSERNVVVNNNLGILNNNPQYPLDIAGDLNFTGTLRQGGAPYVGSQFSNTSSNVFLVGSNLGIGTASPVTNLHVAGSIFARDGLYRTKSKYLTGSYSANTWHTVFNGAIDTDLTSGVYILKALTDTHAAGGLMYSMTHSGIFSWYAGGTNSFNGEGITTHRSGHAPNNEVVSFRTLQTGGASVYFQIYSNYSWTSLDTTGGRIVLVEVTRIA